MKNGGWIITVVVHWQGRLALVTVVASLYMAVVGLLAGLELVVRLVLVLVHILQEVRSQGRREWMRKFGVDHNKLPCSSPSLPCASSGMTSLLMLFLERMSHQ